MQFTNKINGYENYTRQTIYVLPLVCILIKQECYITLGWKSLPGINTQANWADMQFTNKINGYENYTRQTIYVLPLVSILIKL
jgi:hypothetical protein